ncbi:hypothetical protein [Nonomuraea sp. CA-141351]
MVPTIAGEVLLDRTGQLLHDLDETISTTRSVGGEHTGRIARLGEGR